MLALLWCNLALLLAASVLAFPTSEFAFAMQHGSHGGTISALLLYAAGIMNPLCATPAATRRAAISARDSSVSLARTSTVSTRAVIEADADGCFAHGI